MTVTASPSIAVRDLPRSRGPVSAAVAELLLGDPDAQSPVDVDVTSPDPGADDDVQLALWTLYELHFRGFDGIDPAWEWAPEALRLRGRIEQVVERDAVARVEARVDDAVAAGGDFATRFFDFVESFPGPGLSAHVGRRADRTQVLEFLAHRSVYQLKEADPHTFAIPRLPAAPKSTFVEIQYDEYGTGRPDRVHQRLYAGTLAAAGLDDRYAAYVDHVPATTLALSTTVTMLGLHRRLRGAAVGHLAAVEATSSLPCRLYASGIRRVGLDDAVAGFFDEHVEADAVHEQLAVRGLGEALLRDEPDLERDVFLGAALYLDGEARFAETVLAAWESGRPSLAGGVAP